ncbi:hypothetical protein [uncultured Pseudoteredinibacter sp.]|uniref:hypothetical protein n=1 Tax=uncultured Pseudoteredinibacter sp. TaxID=1641701 RepID=UPI00260CE553|nr:hypothetical protein [uncultured Pseudoteredinibacter sp.]
MLNILAMLPTIFSAISQFTELFDAGKKVFEAVTDKPSRSSTPEELQREVGQLSQSQQVLWATQMQQSIDLYKAQSDRLNIEQGLIDGSITSKLTAEAASEIALVRQTTRPWAVRMMVHYVFFPWYLILIDLSQELVNRWLLKGLFRFENSIEIFKTFDYVFGGSGVGGAAQSAAQSVQTLTSASTAMSTMYMNSVGWATSIIIAYMGLREYSKAMGTSGDLLNPGPAKRPTTGIVSGITEALASGADLVGKVKRVFKRQ